MSFSRVCIALGLAALVVPACGGSAFTSAPSTTDGGGGDGGDRGDRGSLADGSVSGPDGSQPPAEGGVPGDGSVPGDGAVGSNDGAVAPTITCPGGRCNRQTQVCCYSDNLNPPPDYVAACTTSTDCATKSGTALKCSSAAECSTSEVCCITKVGNGHASFCQHTCNLPDAELCDPTALPISRCAVTAPCSTNNIGSWGLPATRFGTCGGVPG